MFNSGTYRAVKQIDVKELSINRTIHKSFNIERPSEYVIPEPQISSQYFAHASLAVLNYPGQPYLIINNKGSKDLYVNKSYLIEVLENETWTRFHLNRSQEIEAIKRGESYSQKISVPDLPVGEYRVIFQIGMEGSTETEIGKCRFRVKKVKRPR